MLAKKKARPTRGGSVNVTQDERPRFHERRIRPPNGVGAGPVGGRLLGERLPLRRTASRSAWKITAVAPAETPAKPIAVERRASVARRSLVPRPLGGAAEGGADVSAGAPPSDAAGAGGGAPEPCVGCKILPPKRAPALRWATVQHRCFTRRAALRLSHGSSHPRWMGGRSRLIPPTSGAPSSRRMQPLRGIRRSRCALSIRAAWRRASSIAREYVTLAGLRIPLAGQALPSFPCSTRSPSPRCQRQLDHNTNVYDFRFSPDGRYLVYRYGADAQFPHGRHLALVELSTLDERPLTVHGRRSDGLCLVARRHGSGRRVYGGR